MGILAHKQYSLPAPDKAQQPQPAAARPPSCGGSSSQRSSETAAWAAPTQAAELPASRRPALDWALRTRMRFCSSRPLRLCEDATLASGARRCIRAELMVGMSPRAVIEVLATKPAARMELSWMPRTDLRGESPVPGADRDL